MKRSAYFVIESQQNEEGEFYALIAVEGESGYYKTTWLWGKDIDKAEEVARFKNKAMGISRKEANLIVLSSMRKGAIEKPRF